MAMSSAQTHYKLESKQSYRRADTRQGSRWPLTFWPRGQCMPRAHFGLYLYRAW